MKKIFKNVSTFSCAYFVTGSVFAAGEVEKADQAGDKTVKMFQLKVEIKDALDAYAADYSAATDGVTVEVESLGGGADYGGAMTAKANSDQMPDIFQIEGQGGYDKWKDYIADLSDQPWVADTDLAFMDGDKVMGFPCSNRRLWISL